MKVREFKKTNFFLVVIFLLGVVAILFGVNFYFLNEEKEIKEAKKEELFSIGNLKIRQLSDWYVDELQDAGVIAGDKLLEEFAIECFSADAGLEQTKFQRKLKQLVKEHGYHSAAVFSRDLSKKISSEDVVDHTHQKTIEVLQRVLDQKEVLSSDLYMCPVDSEIFIDFFAPIITEENTLVGIVVLRHDPEKFLFPLIQNWPVKSRTAETLLLKKEDDYVVFLNNVRHAPNSALLLKLPLAMTNVPAVKAALGQKGFFEGEDYRNEKVLAYVDAIAGTPWFFVAKIDIAELYDQFFFRTATPIVFSLVSIFFMFVLFYLFYVRNQKNFYKQLYTTQQEFKTTLYSIGDAVITTNMEGRVQTLNPVAEKLTGWSESDARGRKIDEIFTIIQEETRKEVENPVEKVIKEGVIVGLANHTILVSKNGDEVPISDSGAPIIDDSGEIRGVVLVFRDQVDERKQQKTLSEAKRKMSTLLSNLQGMVYRCLNDADWTMEFVSKGCEELTGYSDWELEGNQIVSYGSIIYPEDRGYVWEKVEESIETREPFMIEYRIVTKAGTIEWVLERGRGIYNEKNELEAIEGFITNITARKNAEIALGESEEMFRKLMEYSPIYVFFKDENIRSLMLSKNFEQMLGRPIDELLGKNMYELFPSDFASKMVEDDLEVLARGKVVTVEENFNGKNYLTIKFPIDRGKNRSYLAGFTMDISERKHMEEALSVSEKLFQTLAENVSVGIFRTDASGMTTYVNSTWIELTGVPLNEALGVGWVKYIHPDDRQDVINGWKQATNDKGVSKAEYRFVHPDGKIVWVKGQAIPELNSSNEIVGYIGSISDVTEIMNSSEAIQQANRLLRTVLDNIPDAVYMKDINGRKVIANYADISNCGADTEEELLGKSDYDFYPEEVASKFWEDDSQVLKSGIPVLQREEHLVNFNKGEKWLSTSKIPFRDKNNKIIGLVGIGHDITLRKKSEEQMLRLTKAVAQIPVSVIITSPEGQIQYVNPKFSEITGYSSEEALGNNPRMLNSGFHSQEFYKSLWETIKSGNDWRGEIQNRKKNGELYWESVNISPVFNETGEIMNFIGIKEDISEKKKILVELVEAKVKAEESDRLKSAFLANMSHEIRTPLNSILGFSNFLTSDDELSPAEKEEYSNIINKSAESLLQIINDIIDISSLETGQLKTFIKPINVNAIMRSLNLVFSRKLVEINKSHLILEMVVSEEISVMADENRFIQIFTNLANNAMKFTVRGTIRFGVESFDDKNVVFFVSDTGIGISPEMHTSIFERFRQVETDKNRTFGGNGLGLAIVKNLVELMGGHISLESEIGKGSTFRFTLPKCS